MLRALSEYHKYLCRQENSPLSPKGFSKVAVNFNMILTSDGTLKDIIPYTQKVMRGKKEVDAPIEEEFPFRYSISAPSAETIDHREKYNFGLVWDKKEKKLLYDKNSVLSFQKNKEKNLAFLEDLNSPVIDAYKNFLSNWKPEEQIENAILVNLGDKYAKAKFVVTIEFKNNFLHNESQVKEKWSNVFSASTVSENEETVQCSISGEKIPVSQISRIHTKLKGINGGQTSGVGLVSFNSEAFCSYNKDQSYNSFVSNEVMERYTEAFNYLASDIKHKQMIDDMTMLFWAMTEKDETPFLETYCCGINGSANDSVDSESLNEILTSVFDDLANGRKADFESLNIDENVEFYILGVKPNTSRLAVKIFEHNTFGNMMKNLALHHEDFKMYDDDKPMALWQIQKELKSPVGNTVVNPDLSVKMLQSILTNKSYPRYLMDNIIHRVKTDRDKDKDKNNKRFIAINKNRVRIIRACLIRFNKIERGAYKMLNKENKEPAYNVGRLFAVIEAVQSSALPELNATIKDRFFASACSTPHLVFPRLLKLSQNHFAKLEGGLKVYYEKMLGEIMLNLNDTFPKSLNMEKQGMFILGYYQQRQSFYTKNNKEEKGE